MPSRSLPWVLVVAMGLPAAGRADPAFFEAKVRPVLVEHCYGCHSQAANKRKGGLVVDTRDGLRRGGDTGPAVVPGKPAESLLIQAVRHATPDLKMPPKGPLPAAVVADLEAWVTMGAPDPRDGAAPRPADVSWADALRVRRGWWSLQPVRRPAVPAAPGVAHPVDRFLQAKRTAAGLRPAEPADRRTLIRRLSLVLTGLPPTPEQVEAFVQDPAADAHERLVDRTLASPHLGERWARHWLDVVRFTETHGNEWNYDVPHAWRYRDYLVRAFNADVSFDQLVREHVAGDLLPSPRRHPVEGFNESVIGTAFWRFGEVNHDDCVEFRQLGYDVADNQIDTFGKAFQGLTIACARCHDHKIDAVSTRDYYALLGTLRSSRLVSHTIDPPDANAAAKGRLRALKEQIRAELAALWQADARALDAAKLEACRARLKVDARPPEDLLHPWLELRGQADVPAAWRALVERLTKERRARAEFNAQHFVPFGPDGWQAAGQGLADGPAAAGDFAVAPDGDAVLRGVYPAGRYTHLLSETRNGALRSPAVPRKKYLSFPVLGGNTSAVRLVSNNCQLNYVNYRALKSPEFGWQRLAIPADSDALHTYAEVMTKHDNPKFPDQLGTLGGDTANARVPYEQAAADPRSFFGVTRVVAHDCEETPRPELDHLAPLLTGDVRTGAELAGRYAAAAEAAVRAWADGRATEVDARWLGDLLRLGLLRNDRRASPRLAALVADYRAAEKALTLPRVVPGLADGPGKDQPVLVRGDSRKPGPVVPRRYLDVLDAPPVTAGSGRRELAERVASPDNPLTARVYVNRVWHHLFGSGLVRTVDDFGALGDRPSHPELLDFLATEFVADGWSTRRLIRRLVLTEAFRQSSRADESARTADPENRVLHHYPARRLEAEAIRDSILAAAGRLDRTAFGPSVHPYRSAANPDRRLFPGPLDGAGRRSLYLRVNLMESPPFLGAFNLPGGKVAQGRRDVTNVPAQALALLNDPFVLQQADRWAERLVRRPDATPAARVEHLFAVALGRPPTADEPDRFARAVTRFAELHGVPPADVLASRAVWADVAHALFNVKEFVYIR